MSYFKFFLVLIIIVGTNSAYAGNASKQNAEICGEKTCEFLLKEMKKFARNGSPIAQATVALMYADGIGTKMDQELSFKYIKKAANNGLSFAEYTLGMLYRKDQVVGKFGKDADYWLKRAAKGNYQPAIDLLVSENKLVFEEINSYQQAVYTPRYEEGVEVIEVNADKYSLTDFYDLLKNEGYGNPSQTGSRIKGRGCGNNSTACNFIDINSQEGALRFVLFTFKKNR